MRTRPEEMHDEAVEALVAALELVGLQAQPAPAGDRGVDAYLTGPDGRAIAVEVKAMSLAESGRVRSLIERRTPGPRAFSGVSVLVADALPESANELLKQSGWGYLDRRGELWLRSDQVFVNDTTIGSLERPYESATTPIRGRVGLSTALWILMHPRERIVIRELARTYGYSASSVHAALQRLRDHALVDQTGAPLSPELFNTVAVAWRPKRTPVGREPLPSEDDALGLNLSGGRPGWVVSGDVAAAALGAPIVVSRSQPDFYVPDATLYRRAIRRLGPATVQTKGATVAVAPSPLVTVEQATPGLTQTAGLPWRPAHPVVIALDLAQDASRGREILDEWTPDGVIRVW